MAKQPLRLPSAGGGVYPAEERFFHPAAHKKRMKPHAPSVPETAYLLFSQEPPGEFERAAALSTFLRIPATCAPRRPPLPGDARFFHPSAHKKRMKPNAPSVPETAYLLFSREPPGEFERAAALSTFLRIPATCAPRRPPSPGDARRGRSPFAFLPQAGACTPPRSDFSIRQRTKNGCSLTPHPFPKPLPTENRFRFIKIRVRRRRARILMPPRARGDFLLRDFS